LSEVEEALRRREIFDNLNKYLVEIKKVIKQIDKNARVFLFGSVAKGNWTYSSDIDILIVTERKASYVLSQLHEKGFSEPFEFHVISNKWLEWYAWYNEGSLIEL
jgi:predicted nucleotidyltransferase